jgi:coproporphyrinogen III oxidase-like Fe-S oxidoreductase
MGLRLSEGIDLDATAERFGLGSIVNWGGIERLIRSGHLKRLDKRIALTSAGRLLLDHILGEVAVPASNVFAAA